VSTLLNADRVTKHIKRQLNLPFAMEIIILMCWSIWSKRNAWIFNNEDAQVQKNVKQPSRENLLGYPYNKKEIGS
jgi:hypothetical protein